MGLLHGHRDTSLVSDPNVPSHVSLCCSWGILCFSLHAYILTAWTSLFDSNRAETAKTDPLRLQFFHPLWTPSPPRLFDFLLFFFLKITIFFISTRKKVSPGEVPPSQETGGGGRGLKLIDQNRDFSCPGFNPIALFKKLSMGKGTLRPPGNEEEVNAARCQRKSHPP